MGYYCTVPQCTSLAGKTKNVKFHRFPRDESMADKWNIILKRGKPYTKYSKVCSLHFTQADYNVTTMGKNKGQWKTLSKDAVPSQNLPKCHADGTVMVIRKSRTIKYRDGRKDSVGEKSDKWSVQTPMQAPAGDASPIDPLNSNIAYRLQTLSAIASTLPPQMLTQPLKPRKQDAIMQTDPVQSEDDDSQPNNSYNEPVPAFNDPFDIYTYKEKDYPPVAEKYSGTGEKYPVTGEKYPVTGEKYPVTGEKYPVTGEKFSQSGEKYPLTGEKYSPSDEKYPVTGEKYPVTGEKYTQPDEKYDPDEKKYEMPKDFSKQDEYSRSKDNDYLRGKEYQKPDDYLPRTNEEYNKEAEKYALERKNHNGFEKPAIDYQKIQENYKNVQDMYAFDKDYPRNDYPLYQYSDADALRSQQHNLEVFQQQHRITENQNFFNENHIKQEIDMTDEDKYSGAMFERGKEPIDVAMYSGHRAMAQRHLEHLQHQVKQEPESVGCDTVMQPQGSPYYAPNGHTNNGYYEQLSRPGPELLIAKQNALAAHTQLWQNTMKRPFFYGETPHYSPIHRYEDLTRILQ